jgi:hypothetical protein
VIASMEAREFLRGIAVLPASPAPAWAAQATNDRSGSPCGAVGDGRLPACCGEVGLAGAAHHSGFVGDDQRSLTASTSKGPRLELASGRGRLRSAPAAPNRRRQQPRSAGVATGARIQQAQSAQPRGRFEPQTLHSGSGHHPHRFQYGLAVEPRQAARELHTLTRTIDRQVADAGRSEGR